MFQRIGQIEEMGKLCGLGFVNYILFSYEYISLPAVAFILKQCQYKKLHHLGKISNELKKIAFC